MSAHPKVAVAVVTYNNGAMLLELLAELKTQSMAPSLVVVVDNASKEDLSPAMRERFPDVRLIRLDRNTGSAGGYRLAVETALAGADFVLCLDDDISIASDAIERLVQGYDSLRNTVRLGAVRMTGYKHAFPSATRLRWIPWHGTLYLAAMVREIGLPRQEYFLYGEDLEYSLRMERSGYECWWVPASKCRSRREARIGASVLGKNVRIYAASFRHYYGIRNELAVFVEYRRWGAALKTLLYSVKVLTWIMIAGPAPRPASISAIVHGVIDGLRVRLGENPRYAPRA